MTHTLLHVKNLKTFFPVKRGILRRVYGHVKAVNDVSFTLAPGETLGIVGESGCGKSTLGRSALHLITPTAGDVIFEGQKLSELSSRKMRELRKDIQIIFQDPYASLNPRKIIADNIGEALLYHKIVSNRQERDQRVLKMLKYVGLDREAMLRYPHEFSGGQQQRICIARAIALEPKLIICDEVVSALDVSVQAQVLNLLVDLKKRMSLSYVFISHDLSVVRYICDRVLILYLGQVMEEGHVEDVFAHPKHPYTQALLSAIPKKHPQENKQQQILTGETPSPIDPPFACPFHTRCPHAIDICSRAFPPEQKRQGPISGAEQIYHCVHRHL